MDEYGFGPVLAWLVDECDRFAGLLGAKSFAGAIGVSYLVVGLGLALLLTPLRRRAINVTDRLNFARPGRRRIRAQLGSNSSGVRELTKRFHADLALSKASLAWLLVYGLAAALCWWAIVTPWSQKTFRREIGQRKPSMFADRIQNPFVWSTNWAVSGVLLFWLALVGWVVFRVVRSTRRRSAMVRAVRVPGPALSLLLAGVITAAAVAATVYLQPQLPLPWLSIVLAGGLGPALWSHARRAERSRSVLPELPRWIFEPDLRRLVPLPETPSSPGTDVRPVAAPAPTRVFLPGNAAVRPADATPTSVLPAPPTVADATPTSVLPATPTVDDATPTAAFFARPENVPTTSADGRATVAGVGSLPVRPDSPWGSLAPPARPLAAYEPARVGGWDIAGRIGSGGMAIVYLAYQGETPVAIKVANPMVGKQVQAPQRLLREIMALSRVGGDSVVAIRDVGIDAEHPYIVMEYLAGPSLAEAVTQLGPIRDPQRLRHLACRLATALESIHGAGMAHRDVKPANVLLTDRGPVVVDLGIAQLADPGAVLTQAGTTLGSIGFIAPEQQLSSTHGKDPARSDVWCWGANVAYAATGLPLFGEPGATPVRILDEVLNGRRNPRTMGLLRGVDVELACLVHECTETDPSRRAGGGAQLAALLRSRGLAPGRWGPPW